MADWASLNSQRITRATVTIPYYGAWSADVELAGSPTLARAAVLVLGSLSLVGTLYRTDIFAGVTSARIIGGGGGWGKPLAAKAYQNGGGVPVSMVLGDAALESGEQLQGAQGNIGNAFVREAAPASRVLRQLAGPLWFIDSSGITQLGARSASPIKSALQVIEYHPAEGRVVIATETPEDWTPGRTFSAPTLAATLTIGSVTHTVTNDGTARTEVFVTP